MSFLKNNLLIIGVVVFIVLSWFELPFDLGDILNYATAQTSSQVSVSANVVATVSCNAAPTSTSFGSIDDNAIYTSSPNVTTTLSCANSSLGCSLFVKDQGSTSSPGLYNGSVSYLIPSPNSAFSATATLAAGTEGYGIQGATTTAGGGSILTLNIRYNQTGNTVGGLTTTTIILASSSATTSNREVVITHKSAVSVSTPSGNYSDTITYSCVAN